MSFLLLNHKQISTTLEVKIGADTLARESSATLLGIRFQDKMDKPNIQQGWSAGGIEQQTVHHKKNEEPFIKSFDPQTGARHLHVKSEIWYKTVWQV